MRGASSSKLSVSATICRKRCEASYETDAGVAPVVSGVYGEPGWKMKLPAVALE